MSFRRRVGADVAVIIQYSSDDQGGLSGPPSSFVGSRRLCRGLEQILKRHRKVDDEAGRFGDEDDILNFKRTLGAEAGFALPTIMIGMVAAFGLATALVISSVNAGSGTSAIPTPSRPSASPRQA